MISVWVNTAIDRSKIEAVINEHAQSFCAYLVTESEPLVNTTHVVALGERTPGMNQIVFYTDQKD